MLYVYCSVFHVNPTDAYNTPASLIRELLEIHGEVKRIEAEELNKLKMS